MSIAPPKIIVVVGPTASGKSSLAIDLAKTYQGEVISADSRQIYRGLDIGTAKATSEEMGGVPHHLIDIVDVATVYTAAQFKADAAAAITAITKRGNLPIIAGGTFFYIDTLLEKITPPEVEPDPTLRRELETLSNDALFTMLEAKDPRRAASIDPGNKRRLVRALEIVETLGEVPETRTSEPSYQCLTLGLALEREDLRARLRSRAESWLVDDAFRNEVADLLTAGVSRERLAEIGFEYQLGLALFDGALSSEEFIETFVQKNWQYAKRQLTWLKRDPNINWVTAADQREIELLVTTFLRS